jgi:type VI protein secretion system component VasF
MLLGFGGRYSAGNRGELSQVMKMTAEKIGRIRGRLGPLSPSWALPTESARSGSDPLVRKLSILAIACAALMVVLFAVYKIVLGSGVNV